MFHSSTHSCYFSRKRAIYRYLATFQLQFCHLVLAKKHFSADWKANAQEDEPLSALALAGLATPLPSSPCSAHACSALLPVQIHVLLRNFPLLCLFHGNSLGTCKTWSCWILSGIFEDYLTPALTLFIVFACWIVDTAKSMKQLSSSRVPS